MGIHGHAGASSKHHHPHRKQVEEQGLRGAKALQELHRRWKALQAEGGEELQSLLAREAELREKPLL